MASEAHQLRERLRHVFWLGGSPCSGKSSIARMLVEQHGFQSYNCDDAFFVHQKQIRAQTQPTFYRLSQMSCDELWMRPVEVQVREELELYHEEWVQIVEDLLALPTTAPILAEGAALLPELVSQVLTDRRRAIWVVPTSVFQRYHYPRRGAWVQEVVAPCTNPERAFANWMERDIGFGTAVIAQARTLGLPIIDVDGSRTIAENAAVVSGQWSVAGGQ